MTTFFELLVRTSGGSEAPEVDQHPADALRPRLRPGCGLSERRDGSLEPAQQLPLDRGLGGQFTSVDGIDQRLEYLGSF